jgi:phage baseplate assembly protein W
MQMIGMDRHTGQPISGIEHLRQSIPDILGTPLGSRRQRMDYGSKLRRFVDLPVNEGWKSAVQAEVARALGRWEPRLKLDQVRVVSVIGGQINLKVVGEYLGDGVTLEVAV